MLDYDPHNWFWIVGGDESQYWSSAVGDYVETLPEGAGVTRIASEAELVEVLRQQNVPPYHRVFTYTVVERLAAAGKLEAAEAAISADLSAKWRFTVATGIDADDAETSALLTAIGADPDVILAPE